jgi:hypothetical protein
MSKRSREHDGAFNDTSPKRQRHDSYDTPLMPWDLPHLSHNTPATSLDDLRVHFSHDDMDIDDDDDIDMADMIHIDPQVHHEHHVDSFNIPCLDDQVQEDEEDNTRILWSAEQRSDKPEICSICFDESVVTAVLPCGHFIHTFCAVELFIDHSDFMQMNKCPLCRKTVILLSEERLKAMAEVDFKHYEKVEKEKQEEKQKEKSSLGKRKDREGFPDLKESLPPKRLKLPSQEEDKLQPSQEVDVIQPIILRSQEFSSIISSTAPPLSIRDGIDRISSLRRSPAPRFTIHSTDGAPVRFMLEEQDEKDQDECDSSDHGSSMEDEQSTDNNVNSVAGGVVTAGVEGELIEAAPVQRSWWQFFVDCLQSVLPRWSS